MTIKYRLAIEKNLPPSRTNHKHQVSVEIRPLYSQKYHDPRFSESQVAVQSLVSVKYKSVDESNPDTFEGLSCKSELFLPCHELLSSSIDPAAGDGKGNKIELVRKNILDKLYIPFELDDDKDSVAERILGVADSMVMALLQQISTSYLNIDPSSLCIVLPLRLEITNLIALPDSKMRVHMFSFTLYQQRCPNFNDKYKRLISRPRTKEEELEEERKRSYNLKEQERTDGSGCPICLEEMVVGDTTKLPCSHRFHLDCIWKWRQSKHQSCPLCRASFNYLSPGRSRSRSRSRSRMT